MKEQHRPLQLVQVSPRWALCCFASLEFHELRGIIVPRLSEKIIRVTSLIIALGNNNTVNAVRGKKSLPFAFKQKKVKFCWKQMTRRLDSEQWDALGAFQLKSKQVVLFFPFLVCDLYR